MTNQAILRAIQPLLGTASLFLGGALLLLGCGGTQGSAGDDRCGALVEAGQLDEALRICGERHGLDTHPPAAQGAARAALGLGDAETGLRWARHLRGTELEIEGSALEASAYQRLDDAEATADAYRRTLRLSQAAGRQRLEAWSLHGLAYLAWEASDYRRALPLGARAQAAAHKAEARDLERLATELLHGVLYAVGDTEAAGRALNALEELSYEGPDAAVSPGETARLLYHRANLYLDEDRPALATTTLEQALERADGAGLERNFYRSAYLNLTHLALEAGRTKAARHYWQAAVGFAEPDGRRPTGLAYYGARVERAEGRPETAANLLRQALANDPALDWRWDLEHQLGRSEEEMGDLEAAAAAYRRSIADVEDLRRRLGFDSFRPRLLAKRREPYESLFLLEARRGRPQAALEAAEGARARSFLDAFATPPLAASSEAPGSAPPTALPSTAPPRRHRDRLLTPVRLGWAGTRLETLETLAAGLAAAPVSQTLPARDVLQALDGLPTLAYFVARGELWIVAAGHRPLTARPVILPPTLDLKVAVDTMAARPNHAVATTLGAALVPRDLLPPPGAPLLLVPDGPLSRLPFAALRLEDGHFLVERHPSTFVPSLNIFATLRRGTTADAAQPATARVLGDPSGDLPAAAAEARAVAQHLGVLPLLGPQATADALLHFEAGAVLHLAAHSGQGAGGPWIGLADGRLAAHRLLTLEQPPRLAVLASCAAASGLSTGHGGNQGLEGSLGAAFLAAGTPAVLAALRSVEDEPTRRLVLRFYQEGGAQRPAAALAAAQRAAAAAGLPAHHWALFAIFGLPDGDGDDFLSIVE